MSDQTTRLMGTEAEWDTFGNLGDAAVRSALAIGATALPRTAPADAPLALGFGAVKAIGEYLRAIANPSGIAVLEQNALAYLRGAIRGEEGPVRDNGQPFTGASDA